MDATLLKVILLEVSSDFFFDEFSLEFFVCKNN